MPQNTDRIRTTHVGSLIRPPKLIEFWRTIEDGKVYDETAFEACLTASVAEVVGQQADTGIDIVSDGEFSKGVNWAFYIFKRLSGIMVRPATPESNSTRVSLGKTDSNLVTTWPASARCRVRAARNIVSPSGT